MKKRKGSLIRRLLFLAMAAVISLPAAGFPAYAALDSASRVESEAKESASPDHKESGEEIEENERKKFTDAALSEDAPNVKAGDDAKTGNGPETVSENGTGTEAEDEISEEREQNAGLKDEEDPGQNAGSKDEEEPGSGTGNAADSSAADSNAANSDAADRGAANSDAADRGAADRGAANSGAADSDAETTTAEPTAAEATAEEAVETGAIYKDRMADEADLLAEYLEREKLDDVQNDTQSNVQSGPEKKEEAPRPKLKAATRKLTGFNALIYERALAQIREVADGARDSSVVEVPIGDLLTQTRFTAEDLGVDTLFKVTVSPSTGRKVYSLTAEARQALYENIGWSAAKVMDFLIVNCPYELYWYDKTVNYLHSLKDHTAANGGEELVLDNAKIRLYLPVSKDYAGDPESGEASQKTEAEKLCLVNTERTGAAKSAVDKAKEIVAQAAELSDWGKLTAYRDAIFELASYNYEAAGDDSAYGDPYQLIYVFDGNPETKVVCEGFAKSFQYLCDLTTWNREISCMTVTGNLGSGTSGVKHMWNVVKLWDGTVYAVDLTNSDDGTMGYPDKLFMVGSKDYDDGSYSLMDGSISYSYDEDTRKVYTEESVALSSGDAHAPHYSSGEEPILEWDLDNRTCTATLTCLLCDEAYALDTTMTVTDYPEEGYSLYTASVTYGGKVYTDERTFPLEEKEEGGEDDPEKEEGGEDDPEKEEGEGKKDPEKDKEEEQEETPADGGNEEKDPDGTHESVEPEEDKTEDPGREEKTGENSEKTEEDEEETDKGSPKVGDSAGDRILLWTMLILMSIPALAGAILRR